MNVCNFAPRNSKSIEAVRDAQTKTFKTWDVYMKTPHPRMVLPTGEATNSARQSIILFPAEAA
jgi:hypothetical protein